jgi:hypothetical protein
MRDKVRLEHHLVQLAVLAQVVALGVGKVYPPVGKQRLHAVDDLVVGEHDGRHAHHASEIPGRGDAVREGRELAVLVREGLVVKVFHVEGVRDALGRG